jgi:general secretion pathway protein K
MKRQRGVAAITAVLIVAVAASAAVLMLAQQSAMLDQTSLVASRAQADNYARAGIDWARGILLQDLATSAAYDGLDEAWAQPLAGMPVDRAMVSGAITDEQGKFNLNNLVQANTVSKTDVDLFRQLLGLLNLSPDLADAVVDWIDADSNVTGNGGAEDSFYLGLPKPYRTANRPMVQVEELYRIRGFDAATVAKLRPYVTAILPPPPPSTSIATKINVNTASDLVLMALMPGVSKDKIEALIALRRTAPLKTPDAIAKWDAKGATIAGDKLGITSDYYLANVVVVQDDVQLSTDALLIRNQARVSVVWQRPRF